MRPNTGT